VSQLKPEARNGLVLGYEHTSGEGFEVAGSLPPLQSKGLRRLDASRSGWQKQTASAACWR